MWLDTSHLNEKHGSTVEETYNLPEIPFISKYLQRFTFTKYLPFCPSFQGINMENRCSCCSSPRRCTCCSENEDVENNVNGVSNKAYTPSESTIDLNTNHKVTKI